MAARPAFPYIGWDPTPGNVEDTRELAKTLGGLATELGTALRQLEQIECGVWKGKTALAFTEYIGHDVTPLIRKGHDSFEKASRALHRWSGELEEFQGEADRLEKSAGEKLKAREDADAKGPGKELGKASVAVDEVTGKVDDLEERYGRAAGAISKDLDKATDIAPNEPGFWDKLFKGVEDAWNATGQWIKDHADMIKLIGDLLSDLTGILALLAIVTLPFPPLAAIFGAAALVTTGLALVAHSVAKAAGADVSWQAIGLDAVGLLPGIGALSKGIKVVGATKAAATAKALGPGFVAGAEGSGRVLMAFGKNANDLTGGFGLAGKVKIGGMSDEISMVAHETSGVMSRLGGIAHQGYHAGQLVGSKGLNLLPKVAINPMGVAAIAFDGAVKIAPKVGSIPQHIGEAVNAGDRFQQSAAAH